MSCVDDNLLKLTKKVNEQCEEVKDQVRRLQTEIGDSGDICQTREKHPGEHKKYERSNNIQLGNVRNVTLYNNNNNNKFNNNNDNNKDKKDSAFTETGEVVPRVSQDTSKLWSALLELYTAFSKSMH